VTANNDSAVGNEEGTLKLLQRNSILALVVTVACFVLVACIVEPTPPVSPLPTVSPLVTPPVSPLPPAFVEFPVVSKPMEEKSNMDAELLASVTGILLSLLFSYVPGIKDWFESLAASNKQALMGLLLLSVSGAVFGLSCAGLVDVGVVCDKAGALGMVSVFVAALIANQSMYLLTKK